MEGSEDEPLIPAVREELLVSGLEDVISVTDRPGTEVAGEAAGAASVAGWSKRPRFSARWY